MTITSRMALAPGGTALLVRRDDGSYAVQVPSEVSIEGFVAALHDIRRFNGQGLTVLEHTVCVIEMAKVLAREKGAPGWEARLVQGMAAAHDLHEVIIGDILAPIGRLLSDLPALAAAAQMAMLRKVFPNSSSDWLEQGITHPIVRLADTAVSWLEYRDIFDPRESWGTALCDLPPEVGEVCQRFTLDWIRPPENTPGERLRKIVLSALRDAPAGPPEEIDSGGRRTS